MRTKKNTSINIRSWFLTVSNKMTYYYLFVVIESVLILGFNLHNLFDHGDPLNSMMLSAGGQANDYFMHIGFASAPIGTNIYEYSSLCCFPPLAYLMYGFLARITGYVAMDPMDVSAHKLVGNNLTIYVLYSIICTVILLYAISLYIKRKGFINQILFPCLLIFSYPFAFSSLQRGNSVLLVAVLLSIAFRWKDEQSKVKRELALFIIAVCAGLKVYPALFGLFYLKEKRFKEAIRLTIYGIVLFFVPFVFFGGLQGFQSFFNTLLLLNGSVHRCSISGLVNEITTTAFGTAFPVLTTVIQNLFLVICIVGFFLSKEKWEQILFLCALMTVYVSSGWMYTCVYMITPLLAFLYEKHSTKVIISKSSYMDVLALILFVIVFSIPYKFGYAFIYDSIIVFVLLFFIYSVIRSAKGKRINRGSVNAI